MAEYCNYEHYIREGWSGEPKHSFVKAASYIEKLHSNANNLLDVGCATGEFLGYVSHTFPKLHLTGADVFDNLIVTGQQLLPKASFINSSALSLPEHFNDQFDVVTALGVMSIFNEEQLRLFWKNLIRVTKPGGLIIVFAPLNEYGVDTIIQHRKRVSGNRLDWESGWNIFSIDTICEILGGLKQEMICDQFHFNDVLKQRSDPVRTWTLPTEKNRHQLTNGLKLLVDHYYMVVKKN